MWCFRKMLQVSVIIKVSVHCDLNRDLIVLVTFRFLGSELKLISKVNFGSGVELLKIKVPVCDCMCALG